MSNSDYLPDYPLNSDLVKRLKSALDAKDEERVGDLICTEVTPVDAVIELANDDWMKDPSAQLPPGMLLGDLEHLKLLMGQFFQDANVVFEINKDEMEWQVKSPATFGLSGLWTLEYKRELTTPLCIAAAHGHAACVRYFAPGRGVWGSHSPRPWRAPSQRVLRGSEKKRGHVSLGQGGAKLSQCPEGWGKSLRGARQGLPHTLTKLSGFQKGQLGAEKESDSQGPLPRTVTAKRLTSGCDKQPRCAQALLEHGASVQRVGGKGRDTPLHVAAQRGLDEHARLYLDRGAYVDARNGCGETALSVACGAARRPDEHGRCLRLCALLLRHGAEADARDEDERSPLHKACGHASHSLARLLLRHGADAGALDYGGASPLARVLQTAACALQAAPQRTVQALFNHGSPTVWPDAFPKVLKTCASAPAVVEVLFNSYPQLCVSESWKELIPEEVFQMHKPFYQSLFALAHTPRCLQHLCRCALRRLFGKRCFDLIPLLPLPKPLQNYVLLEPQGVLH
ncbi:PREDICTED: ankyrin repeat and SOCS box protein 18 [Mandrillus leucophaeus]|uniref:ankyrin repeat and SOCS box protein 18 n=1 Tax=Mandrillus leucophaeus TaxID=9568 RepID=UPI0005F48A22|nr:PREDICTED: ankyrin repeat and SOCS box protein 18 [Mandrillus leucophaeus]